MDNNKNKTVTDSTVDGLNTVTTTAGGLVGGLLGTVGNTVGAVAGGLGQGVGQVGQGVGQLGQGLGGALGSVGDGVKDGSQIKK